MLYFQGQCPPHTYSGRVGLLQSRFIILKVAEPVAVPWINRHWGMPHLCMQACGATDQALDEAAPLQLQKETQATQHSLQRHRSDVHQLQQLVRKLVLSDILPSVVPAIVAVADTRPDNAVQFLAEQLLAAADEQDAHTVDPYVAPIYTERRKEVAKDNLRASELKAAADAKAEREAIAKLEAEKSLTAMLVDSMTRHESMLRS
jgi:hypothetical protein